MNSEGCVLYVQPEYPIIFGLYENIERKIVADIGGRDGKIYGPFKCIAGDLIKLSFMMPIYTFIGREGSHLINLDDLSISKVFPYKTCPSAYTSDLDSQYRTYEFLICLQPGTFKLQVYPCNDVNFSITEDDMINNSTANKEDKVMEPKNNLIQVIDTFTVPEAIAKRLSELLITQSIRERMLDQNIENVAKYEKMEKLLVPVVAEIDTLKAKITDQYVPQKYRSDEYMWKFDGYEIDGCNFCIYKA